ncbi:MAG: deacylase [Nitrospirales bacterium]|nr:MAG: deacylase [Nitrospirales bacterium]
MTISPKLKEYLDGEKVQYEVLLHQEAYTAPEVAHTLHVPGKELAKVIMVKVSERFVMMVLPSTWKVSLNRLKEVFEDSHVRLATEEEFTGLFPDCSSGAMPPFGNLYGLDVYVDRSLTEDEEIVFQAGTRHEAIRMRYSDFAALVGPTVEEFHQLPANVLDH